MGFDLAKALPGFLVVVLSLTVHEYFHARTAHKLGDDTPVRMGRLTLNPIAHIDPFGTLLIPLMLAWAGLPIIGWAKPVMWDPSRIRRGVRMATAELMVSAAGPLSNLGLALVATGVLGVLRPLAPALVDPGTPGLALLGQFIIVNIYLAIFNLVPVPPLDGSHVVGSFLSGALRELWGRLMMLGPILLMALLYIRDGSGRSLLSHVLDPVANVLTAFLFRISRGFIS